MTTAAHAWVNSSEFRAAMARFPTGVAVVTTTDSSCDPHGFTASSFCSASLEPPLVLVCLAHSANSYEVFAGCDHFAVSVLRPGHEDVARRFATKNADKFALGDFTLSPLGLPALDGALFVLDCAVHGRYPAGDHTIMVGEVRHVRLHDGQPMVYFSRGFRQLGSAGLT